MQMFSHKPAFDLTAFLAEKVSPADLRKLQQKRRKKPETALSTSVAAAEEETAPE